MQAGCKNIFMTICIQRIGMEESDSQTEDAAGGILCRKSIYKRECKDMFMQ